jgi:hypothetical protein
MPIKVLQLINSFTVAGAELMAKRLALGFDPRRIRCDLWSVGKSASPESERVFISGLDSAGVACHCLSKKTYFKDLRTVACLIIQMLRERYDIIHSHCPSPDFYGSLAAAAVPGTRSMVTLHYSKCDANGEDMA